MSVYKIHVSGLPDTANEGSILEFFSRVGAVTQCEQHGTTATVSFDNLDDFKEALHMDTAEFEDGVCIHVKELSERDGADKLNDDNKDDERKSRDENNIRHDYNEDENNNEKDAADQQVDSAAANSRNDRVRSQEEFKIAIRQLPADTTEQQLRDLFEPLGVVQDLYIHPTRHYAFVGFDNAGSMEDALQMSGRELNGGVLDIERKRVAGRREVKNNNNNNNHSNGRNISDEAKIVLKNLPPNTDEDAIRSFLSSVGEVVDIFVHKHKSFAFVGFSSEASAEAALRLSGVDFNGSPLQIEPRQKQRCFKCNKEGHMAMHCRATELTCRNCGRPGHVARDCRGQNANRDDRRNNERSRDRRDERRDDRRDERRHERRRQRSRSDSHERRRRRSRSPKRSSRRDRSRSRSRSPIRRR